MPYKDPKDRARSTKAYKRRDPEKWRKYDEEYRAAHRDEAKARSRDWRSALTQKVQSLLGGKCVCCGTSIGEFLTVDHIRNDGGGMRRRKNHYYYCEIVASFESKNPDAVADVTARFALRCCNCNWSKHVRRGKCVHEGGKLPKVGYQAMYFRKVDAAVKMYLGGRCVCCKEGERDFLSVDHVLNDGMKAKRNRNGTRNKYDYYSEIQRAFKGKDPALIATVRGRYQLLCRNCNSSKHYGKGVCVHRRSLK